VTIINCFCACLHPGEDWKTLRGIQKTFTCLEDAYNALDSIGKCDAGAISLSLMAALTYVIFNISPERKKEFNKGCRAVSHYFKPCDFDKIVKKMLRLDAKTAEIDAMMAKLDIYYNA